MLKINKNALAKIILLWFLALPSVLAAPLFAIIGDFGDGSSDEGDVAGLVYSWNPEFIITTGDNRYDIGYDAAVGQFYCDSLANSGNGANCSGGSAVTNQFFPSLGNHDYDDGGGLSEYLNYFDLPGAGIQTSDTSGTERYYDFIKGSVHFFAIDSEGALLSSSDRTAQMNWLQQQLAASTAPWKIVYFHHAAFSSGGETNEMQWPFADWGADAVITGHIHFYERVFRDGIVYFVNGLGGEGTYGFDDPTQGSQVRYNSDFGAMRVDASDTSITYEFVNRQGSIVDNYTVLKDGPAGYCNSSATDQNFEYIGRVQVGNLDNTSGASTYSDFTNLSTTLTAGANTSITLTPQFPGASDNEFWRVWIDFNGDGDFGGPGELVFSGSGNTVVNGSFIVPNGIEGSTRMRVSMQWNAFTGACASFTYGEVEDYSVEIVSAPSSPDADFSATPASVALGGTVQFTDQSSSNPTAWSWTFPGGTPATSTLQNPTVTYDAAGSYEVTLTANNAIGGDSETKSNYISVTDTPAGYCASSASDQNYEYISRVQVGDLDNPSGASTYSDFTGLSATLTAGTDTSITLTPGFPGASGNEFWRIWIDYNGDDDFGGTGELVFSGSGNAAVNGNFIVPTNVSGNTRMRVSMQWNAFTGACGSFTYGEVEDYSIEIISSGPQAPVADFTASSMSVAVGGTVQFTDQSSANPTSWSWTFAGGTPTTSTQQNPTITYSAAGTYEVTLVASNTTGSDSEIKSGYINVTDVPISYCNSSAGDQSFEYIGRVQVGNLDNPSAATAYSDFTNLTATLAAGTSSNLLLTPTTSGAFPEFWRIWIDYNGDGDFVDAGELVFSGSGNAAVNGSFNVPGTASGTTRMRVSMQWNAYANPCEVFAYGEVEDYSVNITP